MYVISLEATTKAVLLAVFVVSQGLWSFMARFCIHPGRISDGHKIQSTEAAIYTVVHNCLYISYTHTHTHTHTHVHIQNVPGGNVPDFRRMFLTLKYTDITQNTYIRS